MSSAKVDSPPRPVYSNRLLPRPLRQGKSDEMPLTWDA